MNPSDRFVPFGYQLDSDSELYYVQARSYDPTVGRWLVEEPVGEHQDAPAANAAGSSE